MRDLDEALQRWRDAGLLSQEQVDAIAAVEGARGTAPASAVAPPAPAVGDAPPATRRRSAAAEGLGYVGAALAVGALFLLLSDVWEQLLVGARLALVGMLTGLALAAAAVLRGEQPPPVRRLVSVLQLCGVVGVGWLTVIVTGEMRGWDPVSVVTAVGAAASALALPLYLIRPRALLQLASLGSLLVLAMGALSLPGLVIEPLWYGVALAGIGGAWLALGIGNWLRPTRLAETAGAAVALVGLQVTTFDRYGLAMMVLAVAVTSALVVGGVARGRLHLVVVGALGVLVLVPQLVFEVFGDTLGAPAVLLVVGLLLVLLAAGVGRARRGSGASLARPPPPRPSGDPGHEGDPEPEWEGAVR
jgi:hypothetical protein